MSAPAKVLLAAATDSGLLDGALTRELLAEARRTRKDPLDLASTRLRLPREAFYRALAARRELTFLEPAELVPDAEALAVAPQRLLERKRVLPLRREGDALLIATANPDDRATLDSLARLARCPLTLALADPAAIEAAVLRIGAGAKVSEGFDAVAFLERLLQQALLRRASDVHLDPRQEGLVVRLRVDGKLRPWGSPLSAAAATSLLTRIKVLGGLDIAERREPQDGGFTYATGEDQSVDVRLATIPARHGERATLRLLGVETRELTLSNLGFAPQVLERFETVLHQPHGMVLLTGPTGSGKSTTLYAALRAIQNPEVNVMTVEDPIEFQLDDATQIQVDRAGKVTFAAALRSLLRHDPDVLMVGEIRDRETADVAVKAAMTGHLVLSSLHTNRATSAPLRLVDIGCEPYLVASTLRAVIAQRLVRRLCVSCRAPLSASADALAPLGLDAPAQVFAPVGCPGCMGTGYRGRLALTEALWLTPDLSDAIANGAGEQALRALAAEQGLRTLLEDGRQKVLEGATSIKEAAEVNLCS